MSVLGRFGSWLSKTQAFGSLLAKKFGGAAHYQHETAADKARKSMAAEVEAAIARRTPGAFGMVIGTTHHNAAGSKLGRRCKRAYRESKILTKRRVPTGKALGETTVITVPLYKLNVRGY